MAKQLHIRIYKDGKIQAKTEDIKGKSCADYIGILESLLEAKTVDTQYTQEYYETEENQCAQVELNS